MKKTLCVVLGLLACWAFMIPPDVQAECRVQDNAPTYTEGQLKDLRCNSSGVLEVEVSGGLTTLGTANAANPTFAEAAAGYLSWDLAGNLRVTQGTLIEGEDQTNHLLQTSGGAVRLTTFSSVTSATTSSVTTVPIGVKTFMAYMGGASETKAFDLTIYGNWQNSTTGGQAVCRIYVPSTASITHIEARCPQVEENFTYWYYTAGVYTSASSASLILYAQY